MVTVSSADMQTTCGLRSFDGGDEVFRRDVGAEIDDLESAALEHGGDDVLANVVQVAFDGADDDADRHLLAGGGEQRLEQFHGALHGAAGEQELGNEILFGTRRAGPLPPWPAPWIPE